jgi:hypothetical protein
MLFAGVITLQAGKVVLLSASTSLIFWLKQLQRDVVISHAQLLAVRAGQRQGSATRSDAVVPWCRTFFVR